MNVKEEISKTIEVLKKLRKFKSQKDIALHLGYNVSYFSRAINEKEIPIDLEEKFFSVFPRSVYLSQYDSLFPTDNIFDEPYTPEPKPDKKADALKQLDKIKSQNGKGSENEGKIVDEDEMVPVPTYIIPIKGFANLRKHMFSDDYIDRNFEKTITYVPKSERVPRLLKIQSTGKSMIPKIEEGDFVYCEPIPDIDWMEYKFRADKIYCFFHFIKGILFKRAQNTAFGEIRLTSDNPDKIEYPDIDISIGEFKNILIVRKIEKIV